MFIIYYYYVNNNLPKLALRKDFHTYSTRSFKVVDIPYQRLSNSQNSYEVLGFKMYSKLKLELEDLPTNVYKAKKLFKTLFDSQI